MSATAGPLYAVSSTQIGLITLGAWTSPGSVVGAPDAAVASITRTAGAMDSRALVSRGRSFAVPGDASIVGYRLAALIQCTSGDVLGSLRVQLYDGSTPIGAASVVDGETLFGDTKGALTEVVFGGETDLWGATLTPALANSATFGEGFTVTCASGAAASMTVRIDAVAATAWYARPIRLRNRDFRRREWWRR